MTHCADIVDFDSYQIPEREALTRAKQELTERDIAFQQKYGTLWIGSIAFQPTTGKVWRAKGRAYQRRGLSFLLEVLQFYPQPKPQHKRCVCCGKKPIAISWLLPNNQTLTVCAACIKFMADIVKLQPGCDNLKVKNFLHHPTQAAQKTQR